MTRPGWTLSIAAALVALTASAGPAHGQYRLEDGRILDRNTRVGGDGVNEASRVEDFRARNLLVTGNVAGGRGFRDTVGYAAENDFRGALGSDDLFPFLAGSAFSAPSFLTAAGTAERLRFGGYLGTVEYRRSGGFATSLRDVDEIRYTASAGLLTAPEQFNIDHVALASSPGMRVAATAQPEFVGAFQDGQGNPVIASASVLRGLQMAPLTALPETIGLTSYDLARTLQDVQSGLPVFGVGSAFDVGFGNLDPTWKPPASGAATSLGAPAPPPAPGAAASPAPRTFVNRLDPGREPEYRGILERIVDRYQATTAAPGAPGTLGLAQRQVLENLDSQLARLRDQMLAPAQPGTGAATTPGGAPGAQPARPPAEPLSDVLRHGERLDRLASPDKTRFNELMASAEMALAEGEYFWAERRFDRALRYTPDHPLAIAGLGHARIGAGLYASAALTLRRLLARHPEMIDVTYAPRLLPNRVRLDAVIPVLEQHAAQAGTDQGLYGFLLAYLGHQLADQAQVERGLTSMAAASPDDPVLPVLREVWGSEDKR